MPKWQLLQVVTLALINTAEWVNSIEQHDHNLNWKDIFLHPMKDDNELFIQDNVPQTTSLRSHFYNPEHQSNDKESLQTEPSMGSIGLRSPISTKLYNEPTKVTKEEHKNLPTKDEIDGCLKKNIYCDNIENYPNKIISESFNKADVNLKNFPHGRISTITTEQGLNPICADPLKTVYPRAAKLFKTDEWRYIVQVSSFFEQGIEIMPCSNNSEILKPCSLFKGTSMCCKQEYTYLKLMTMNSTGGIYYEQFHFPFICRCAEP